jgi:hypothetical protein
MTTEEEHKTIQDELEEDINEKITRGILGKRQKLIGFSTSEASTNLFARLLHKLSLISAGFNVNHRFFASLERAKEAFASDFPNKDIILKMLVDQEKDRDRLCYGKNKGESLVKEAVKNYFKLKEIIEEEINKGEEHEKE